MALDSSTRAMDEALLLAREREAGLTALFVLDATWNDFLGHDWLSGSQARAGFLDYVRDEETAEAEKVSQEFAARAAAVGVIPEIKVAAGRVAEEILKELATGYDYLVLARPFGRGRKTARNIMDRLLTADLPTLLLVRAN